MLRTSDAARADGVIFAAASVDPYNTKCVRSSAGSLFHLPVVAGVPLADATAGPARGRAAGGWRPTAAQPVPSACPAAPT